MKIIYLRTRAELTEKLKEEHAKGLKVFRVSTECNCNHLPTNPERYYKANQRNGVLVLNGDTAAAIYIKCKNCAPSPTQERKERTRPDRRPEILKQAFDILAAFPCLENGIQKDVLCTELLETLEKYPCPQRNAPDKVEAAYLYTRNARTAAKLALMGYEPYHNATHRAAQNIERAFSLLVDTEGGE